MRLVDAFFYISIYFSWFLVLVKAIATSDTHLVALSLIGVTLVIIAVNNHKG